jgi:chemotaxis protein methyltransferase CheR
MAEAMLAKMARLRIVGKSPVGAYLRLSEWAWNRLPRPVTALLPFRVYGHLVNSLVRLQDRRMYLGTYFLRNRPELELIARLAEPKGTGRAVKIAVLGSSNGAEVYSIAWAVRSARPDVELAVEAVDISREALQVGQEGVYELGFSELVKEPIFERMTAREIEELFEKDGERLRVRPRIKEGITWRDGDVEDPRIVDALGPQDIVVANRFLCHLRPAESERCLRNIGRFLAPGGYLFVSGVDLDVRTRVANELGWRPVLDRMEHIHEGDPSLRTAWPHRYWGLEPMDRRRSDWKIRYASVFQSP